MLSGGWWIVSAEGGIYCGYFCNNFMKVINILVFAGISFGAHAIVAVYELFFGLSNIEGHLSIVATVDTNIGSA